MKIESKARIGVLWSAAEKWGGKLFTFIIFVILARLLTPQDFGLIAIAAVFIRFIEVLVEQGFGDALIQREQIDEYHISSAFWINIVLSIVLFCICIISANGISILMEEPKLKLILQYLSLSILIRPFSLIQISLFKRNLNFKIIAKSSLTSSFIAGSTGVILALNGFGVWSLVIQQLLGSLLISIFLWISSQWLPRFIFSLKHVKELFSFGINIVGTNLLNFINRNSDDIIIGYFLGAEILGIYTVAYKVIRTLTSLISSVGTQVAFPVFSKIKSDLDKVQSGYYSVTKIVSMISFPIFFGLAITSENFVEVIFGSEWSESVMIMQILSFIGALHSIFYFNGSVLLALGKSNWRFLLTLLDSILNLIFFLIAVQWGIIAVALAYVIRGYITSPIPILLIRKLIGISFGRYFESLKVSIFSVLIMVIIVYGTNILLVNTEVSIRLFSQIIVGIISYIVIIRLFFSESFNFLTGLLFERKN